MKPDWRELSETALHHGYCDRGADDRREICQWVQCGWIAYRSALVAPTYTQRDTHRHTDTYTGRQRQTQTYAYKLLSCCKEVENCTSQLAEPCNLPQPWSQNADQLQY